MDCIINDRVKKYFPVKVISLQLIIFSNNSLNCSYNQNALNIHIIGYW